MSFFRRGNAPRQAAPYEAKSQNKPSISLKVMRPEKFADAPLVADELLAGSTVVMNVEKVERDELRHLLDFISGVVYSLDGGMKKIAGNTTFILTPGSVTLSEAESLGLGEAPEREQNPVSSLFSSPSDTE
jgi:FtsZ-interacting cell division protein YlmF